MGYLDVFVDGCCIYLLWVFGMVGFGLLVVIVGSLLLWSGWVFVEVCWLLVVLFSIGLVGFCLYVILLGMLVGINWWI